MGLVLIRTNVSYEVRACVLVRYSTVSGSQVQCPNKDSCANLCVCVCGG